MKLYSIRHKVSGKFFHEPQTWRKVGRRDLWCEHPRYWKTIDGVTRNVKKIGSDCHVLDWRLSKSDKEGVYEFWTQSHGFKNFNPDLISEVEVIVTNVSVLGEESFPASSFVQDEALA